MTNTTPVKARTFLKRYMSDIHAQSVVGVPTYAISETLNGFSVHQSLLARTIAYSTGLFGTGAAYAIGNDLVRRGVSRLGFTSKLSQTITDSMYGGVFTYGYSAALYMVTSQISFKDAQQSAISAAFVGFFIGGPLGYVTNLWRDCFSIPNPDGKPTFVRHAPFKTRMATVGISAILALGLTVATYTANKEYHFQKQNKLEQRVVQ